MRYINLCLHPELAWCQMSKIGGNIRAKRCFLSSRACGTHTSTPLNGPYLLNESGEWGHHHNILSAGLTSWQNSMYLSRSAHLIDPHWIEQVAQNAVSVWGQISPPWSVKTISVQFFHNSAFFVHSVNILSGFRRSINWIEEKQVLK